MREDIFRVSEAAYEVLAESRTSWDENSPDGQAVKAITDTIVPLIEMMRTLNPNDLTPLLVEIIEKLYLEIATHIGVIHTLNNTRLKERNQ